MGGVAENRVVTGEARMGAEAAASLPVLEEVLSFYAHWKHHLFTDLYIRGEAAGPLKVSYTRVMPSRYFNSLLYDVRALAAALRGTHELNLETQAKKIASAKAWVKEKEEKLVKISADVRSITSYKQAKQKAKAKGKRLPPMDIRLKKLNLTALSEERKVLGFIIHNKMRYIKGASERLEGLKKRGPYSVCFGSKDLFSRQHHLEENGYASHKEWKADFDFARKDSATFVGSDDESQGNQTAQYYPESGVLLLRLPKTPQFEKLKLKGNVLRLEGVHFQGRYKAHIVAALAAPDSDKKRKRQKTALPVQVRLIKRKKKAGQEVAYYVQISTEVFDPTISTRKEAGAIGVDLNADHLAITECDRHGNWLRSESLPFDFSGLSSEQSAAVLGDLVAAVVEFAEKAGKPIVIEQLNFSAKKARLREESNGYARMLSSFCYEKFRKLMAGRCAMKGVELILVNPAYSSIIGKIKFYKLDITTHEKAALVLARRALRFSERLKVFHGTRGPPERMVIEVEHLEKDDPLHKARHVWSFWARQANTIRQAKVRGSCKKPRATEDFGKKSYKYPQAAKAAAGVMTRSDVVEETRKSSSETDGSVGNAARPIHTSALSDQV